MDLIDFYKQRSDIFENEQKTYRRKASILSFLRLAIFLLIPIQIVFFWSISIFLAVSIALILLLFFGLSIKRHILFVQEEKVSDFISNINQNELKSIARDLKGFYGGADFKPKEHKYASDLDILGESSLYSLVNRASTWPGRIKVAEWLLYQSDLSTVTKRQEAISELSDRVDFRQKLQSFFVKTPELGTDPASILEWIRSQNLVIKPLRTIILIASLSLISLIGVALVVFGKGYALLTISLVVNLTVGVWYSRTVNQTHEKLSRSSNYLKMYSEIIGFIEGQKFESNLLNEYSKSFFQGEKSANHSIKRLSKILERFDVRLNAMIGGPLNLFFFWDIWQLIGLEKWKLKHGNDIGEWFNALGEFEAISSFANLAFNNKDWAFPKINDSDFVFNAKNLGHPLIFENKRISNDFSLSGQGKMILVTGSNMSGKSTFLRTLGVNIVLAGLGAPVCASACEISLRTPYTSMRIADSLEENISTFYAELKRISEIIRSVDKGEPVFLLLDEVLRGTNSNDRHKGALVLLKQLINNKAIGVIATHDLELADQELISKGMLMPYYFDVQVEKEELFFDYKIHQGQCKTLNASILMKKMGINLDLFDS
jgi:ABC-type multidrug transport system fused ATPase/permease subunit